MTEYITLANEINEEIIENRRLLHRFPETGFQLDRTVEFVEKKLKEYGIEPLRIGKAGVSATIGKPGKTVLLRADMDALPMKEETELLFASENEFCHSCGHDAHTAMLLGAARVLKETEEEIEGTVKLMFQPAEELLAGAQDMIEAGILHNPEVDAAIAMHIYVGNEISKTGTISYARGAALFSGDAIKIHVKGKNAHGSTPDKGIDAISIAAHIVIALQQIIAREVPTEDQAVVIVGKISGGDTVNTLAGNAELEVSVRATTEEKREYLKNRVREISENVARTYKGEAKVEFWYGMGPLYNDPELTDQVAGYCGEIIGEENLNIIPIAVGTEDFTSVAAEVPGVMINLGVGSVDEGYNLSIHNPGMVLNEDALHIGSALYAHCATRYLSNKG
ncbi:M20 metallopeptidase family protein [Gudongella sp. DL1XJH-153]|uniref:M20 metallopeptidase family protein n=1 Tax=Gudongella sp. DL1XJH-153 TaxID=3409804 RepID=UPI003BB5C2B1